MEEITDGVNNMNISDLQKRNRIQVSNTKKPLFFYVNLAKVKTLISAVLDYELNLGFSLLMWYQNYLNLVMGLRSLCSIRTNG